MQTLDKLVLELAKRENNAQRDLNDHRSTNGVTMSESKFYEDMAYKKGYLDAIQDLQVFVKQG